MLQKWVLEVQKDARNFSLEDWKGMEGEAPKELNVNISEICNARCSFCVYRKTSGPRHIMDLELYWRAIGQYKEMGGETIVLNPLTGEPLTDPHLFERLDKGALAGIENVIMYTNGINLRKDGNVGRLLSSGVTQIYVSIGGFDNEVYKRVMGVDKYSEMMEGLKELLRENMKLDRPKSIGFEIRGSIENLMTEDFFMEILPLVDRDFVMNNIFISKLFDDWSGSILKEELEISWDFMPKGTIRLRPCRWTFGITVMANGLVRACGCRYGNLNVRDELIVGDLNRDDLRTIWESEAVKRIRRSFARMQQAEVCSRCRAYSPI